MNVVEVLSKIRIVDIFGLDCERLEICLVVFSIELEACCFDRLQKRNYSVCLCLIDCIKKLGLFGSIVGIDNNWSFNILAGSKNRGNFNYRLYV